MASDFQIQQLELFAEMKTQVNILPSFNEAELFLLSGQISRFKANHETTVPLWLALLLKKQQKCKILPMFWMSEPYLQEMYALENSKDKEKELICLQNDEFFEISYIVLNKAPDDLDNPTKIRNLIDSLKDLREDKIRKILNCKKGVLINNATTYELNKFRKVKEIAMSHLSNLSKTQTK